MEQMLEKDSRPTQGLKRTLEAPIVAGLSSRIEEATS